MKVHPLFGAGIAGQSLVVTAQRRLNCYFENRSDKDRTPIACYGTPGMQFLFKGGSGAFLGGPGSPCRGMLGIGNNLYLASGEGFYEYNLGGFTPGTSISPVVTGVLNSSGGNVSFANDPTQVALVDGVNGYYIQTSNLTQITSAGFPNGAKTLTFSSGYFLAEVPGTQMFQVSNFYDVTTWNALAQASVAQYGDTLLACDNLIGNPILFSGSHTEIWQIVAGQTPQPFAPVISATVEWGLAAIFSRAHVDNSIIFLAASPQGGYAVIQLQGYQFAVVSNPDLDYLIGTFTTVSDATALAYRVGQHPMYQLNFPTANRSFLFDCATRLWSEVQTGVTGQGATRHIGNFAALAGNFRVISDYSNANFYIPNLAQYTDNGTTIERHLITRHQDKDFNEFGVDEFFCDFETGVGLNSGQGVNPQVQITCSKNDGRTYLTPLYFPLGAQGNFLTRVTARRWGHARRFTWSVKVTDPVKFAITSGAQSERVREQN